MWLCSHWKVMVTLNICCLMSLKWQWFFLYFSKRINLSVFFAFALGIRVFHLLYCLTSFAGKTRSKMKKKFIEVARAYYFYKSKIQPIKCHLKLIIRLYLFTCAKWNARGSTHVVQVNKINTWNQTNNAHCVQTLENSIILNTYIDNSKSFEFFLFFLFFG